MHFPLAHERTWLSSQSVKGLLFVGSRIVKCYLLQVC